MKKLENPEPYKHVMVSYKIGLTNFSKKGWYNDIENTYSMPAGWENCSYGQRPNSLMGHIIHPSDVISWEEIL